MSADLNGPTAAIGNDEPVYLGFDAPGDMRRLENYRTQWDAPPGPIALQLAHGPVARINLYVGANNSGKSRLLRALLHAQPSGGLHASAYGMRTRAIDDLKAMSEQYPPDSSLVPLSEGGKTDRGGLYRHIVPTQIDWACKQIERWPLHSLLRPGEQTAESVVPGSGYSPGSNYHGSQVLRFALWRAILSEKYGPWKRIDNIYITATEDLRQRWPNVDEFANILDLRAPIAPAPRIYIPILRSAHTLHGCGDERDLAGDIFLKTVVENYDIQVLSGTEPQIEVFTGLQLYEQVLRDRCGPKPTRERIDAFEAFLGKQFFGGQAVEIVSRYTTVRADQHINVKIGAREERKLHDLGDGINALILILYKVFMADPGTWLFIEEPELNLHPGLQRIFLDTLLHDPWVRERDLRVFMTTHSNHLVGMAMHHPGEVSVFAVTPEGPDAARFLVRAVQGPELALLDELGVDNASVFLANCSLWVEGPSDRIYLRAFLAAYARAEGKQFREDLDFSFLDYGGSNLKHYAFGAAVDGEKIRAQFVANRVFLLADHDNAPEEKYASLRAAAGASGGAFEFATTEPAREVENLLSLTALRAMFQHQGGLIGRDLQAVDPAQLAWDVFTPAERLADKYHANLAKVFAGTPAAGILFDRRKIPLANALARAIEQEQINWADLGAEAQALTRRIAAFIDLHNPGRGAAS